MRARRLLLVLMVAVSACGCGVTSWQRDQDAAAVKIAALRELSSPDMQRRIDEARAPR